MAAIVVDAVVRDSKGKPVTNLRKEDFELLEDGVRQEIGDLTVVMPGPTTEHTNAATAPAERPTSGTLSGGTPSIESPSFLAIVFDRLTPEARALAYKGALAYLDTLHQNDYAAIFLSDLTLTTIQPYTNDRVKLQTALRDAASRATSGFDRAATKDIGKTDSLGDAHASVPVVASAESAGRPVDNRAGFAGEVMAAIERTHSSWESMARDQQGYATTNALLAVTTGLGALPGRKSVVFFAEGLSIPDAVLPHFRNVITNANRGNVSVYTIDAGGLRVHSTDAEIGREVRAMGAAGLTVNLDGSNQSGLGMMERNEDVLRKDPRTSLTLLAQQTGGFLVENTNNLADAFRQVDSDRRFHYLLTYTPKNGEFDGRWRTITVRAPNQRVNIRARSGYLAVRSPATVPLLAYEGPALAALERSPAPTDLPVRAVALVFPDGSQNRLVVLAATDAGALRFDRDAKTQTYRTDFSILARIVDSKGEVIRKSSQPYRLSGPLQQIEQAQRGDVLFFRQPALPAGTYTVEVAVHDALATRSGVRRETFIVPEAVPQSLQVSSLVLVARGERVQPDQRAQDNPLYVGDILIYPNLGEPIRKSREKALTFLVVVRPDTGSAPQATVEILRDGQVLAQAPSVLPGADASGRIQHIGQVSIDALSPGRYSLRLTTTQGTRSVVRVAVFELMD
ncbi:MAG: VWA domain-containing protein [Acidobacteriota bacterium]|nr:VWA domain-containing protein [Acidobacteriota bacterium]